MRTPSVNFTKYRKPLQTRYTQTFWCTVHIQCTES